MPTKTSTPNAEHPLHASIVQFVEKNANCARADIAKGLGKDAPKPVTLTGHLRELVEAKRLERTGNGRATRYTAPAQKKSKASR